MDPELVLGGEAEWMCGKGGDENAFWNTKNLPVLFAIVNNLPQIQQNPTKSPNV